MIWLLHVDAMHTYVCMVCMCACVCQLHVCTTLSYVNIYVFKV